MKTVLLLSAAFLLALPVLAQHAEKCEPVPQAEWKPQAELERKLADRGWKISRVKITNGCYEVYGRDARNNKMETFFHPRSFEVVSAPK